MALEAVKEKVKEKYIPKEYGFYRDHYHHVIIGLMAIIFLMIVAVNVVFYQMIHRPLPLFHAQRPDGQTMRLNSYTEPNLLPDTLLQWANKAATVAYTFDFVNYNRQIAAARPYFTDAGWRDYILSVSGFIDTIVQNKLFVNGVVSGTPVIANQGPLPGKGYSWRVQIPFLVTYQSANITTKRNYIVTLMIVRVPTQVNPQGIGIDQFLM